MLFYLIGPACALAFLFYRNPVVVSARQRHSRLAEYTPSGFQLWLVTNLLLVKYVLRALGWLPRLKDEVDGVRLPDLSITAPFQVSEETRSLFAATRSHESMLLPCVTNPLVLLLFSKLDCPIFPIGSVNTKNRFEYLGAGEGDRVVARIGGDRLARKVKRGIEVDIEITVYAQSEPVFRQIFTVLQFMRHKTPVSSAPAQATEITSYELEKDVKLSTKDPWKWAAVCKDYNPIHISPIAAKLFGMPGQMIHGSHGAAIALQAADMEIKTGDAIEISFLRPTTIPSEVQVMRSNDIIHIKRKDKVTIEIRKSKS